MPKQFYSERDIEDLVKRGTMTLEINDQVVLTDLAYEKADRLGLQLVKEPAGRPENPPGAPVRPYLSQANLPPVQKASVPTAPAPRPEPNSMQQRIHSAVISRLGTQIDPNLLDLIITRVLRSTGLK